MALVQDILHGCTRPDSPHFTDCPGNTTEPQHLWKNNAETSSVRARGSSCLYQPRAAPQGPLPPSPMSVQGQEPPQWGMWAQQCPAATGQSRSPCVQSCTRPGEQASGPAGQDGPGGATSKSRQHAHSTQPRNRLPNAVNVTHSGLRCPPGAHTQLQPPGGLSLGAARPSPRPLPFLVSPLTAGGEWRRGRGTVGWGRGRGHLCGAL